MYFGEGDFLVGLLKWKYLSMEELNFSVKSEVSGRGQPPHKSHGFYSF